MGVKVYVRRLFLVAFLVVAFLQQSVCASRWTELPLVAKPKYLENISNRAIASDNIGHPYIIYGGEKLYLAKHNGSYWQYYVVDDVECKGEHTSIAIDDSNTIHIAYVAFIDDEPVLKYASGKPGSFTVEVIDADLYEVEAPYNDLWFPSVAADTSGHTYIAYCKGGLSSNALVYARNNSGTWKSDILVATVGEAGLPTILVDSTDKVHLLYADGSGSDDYAELIYATNTGGASWPVEVLDDEYYYYSSTSPGQGRPAMALSSANNPHVFYCENEHSPQMWYLSRESGSWQSEVVQVSDFSWSFTSLCLDAFDQPNVSFTEFSHYTEWFVPHYKVTHGKKGISGWQFEQVGQPTEHLYGTSIVTDSSNIKHLCYFDDDFKDLYYGRKVVTDWTVEKIDEAGQLFPKSCLKADDSSHLHLIYGDTFHKDMRYKNNTSGSWVTETAADECWAEFLSSNCFTLDSAGAIHAAGMAGSSWETWYMTNASGTWETERILMSESMGAAAGVDSSGHVHVILDRPTTDIRHYCNAGGLWGYEEFDDIAQVVNGDIDMAIDATDQIHVAYGRYRRYEWLFQWYEEADIRYAKKVGSTWYITVVDDEAGLTGGYTSLAVDSARKVHISYYNGDTHRLMYATNKAGYWQKEVVDSATAAGTYSSIELDSSDTVYIAYVDINNEQLKCAKGSFGSWTIETAATGLGQNSGYPSIALDPNDNAYISFYRGDGQCLKYATDVYPGPEIFVSPTELLFAVVENGSSTKTVTVENVGSAALTVQTCQISGPDASQFHWSASLPVILQPEESTTIDVTFDPTTTGSFEATLRINSTDDETPWVEVSLSGICFTLPHPDLTLTLPKNWESFGEVHVDQNSELAAVKVKNTGTNPLNIVEIGLSDSNNFVLEEPNCPPFPQPCYNCSLPPFSLAPDEFCMVGVVFAPTVTGPLGTLLYVHAGQPHPAASSVLMEGIGLPALVPHILVTPPGYDFAFVVPGYSSDPVIVTISNTGTGDLELSEVTWSDEVNFTTDPNAGKFPLGMTFPVVISPDEKRMLSMEFSPTDFDTFTNELRIVSNDPQYYKVFYDFEGEGYIWNLCDFDVDYDVDFEDYAILADQWLKSGMGWPADVAPVPRDKQVNFLDLMLFAYNWLAVPE